LDTTLVPHNIRPGRPFPTNIRAQSSASHGEPGYGPIEEVLRIGSRDSVSALEVSPSRSVDSADTTEVIRLA